MLGTCHDIIYSPKTHTKFIANNTTNRCRVSFTVPEDDASGAGFIATVLVLDTYNGIIESKDTHTTFIANNTTNRCRV